VLRMRACLFALVLVTGCAQPIVDADGGIVGSSSGELFRSGSRIKAKTLVTSDGVKEFRGWYDTQLGEDCAFLTASDGRIRCLPGGAAASGFFTDAVCSTPAATALACSSPRWVLATEEVGAGCRSSGGVSVHITRLVSDAGVIYQRTDAGCLRSTLPTGFVTYVVGLQVPPTEFVEGVVGLE
jgi:hypothetical protein